MSRKQCFLSLLGGAAFACMVAVSCKIGLGSAVDTEAPTVAITAPSASDVLRSSVTLRGTCHDDVKVTRVAIVLSHAETKTVYVNKNATVSSDGSSWSFSFDTNNARDAGAFEDTLPDGTYEISVTAYDAQGNGSGSVSRTFDIDNTPPVFVLSKPNSTKISDPASYGRTVRISGEISDDHSVSELKVHAYRTDSNGKPGAEIDLDAAGGTSTFSGFDTLGGTNVVVAKFFSNEGSDVPSSDEERLLHNNYKALYGTPDKNGDSYVYLAFELTDKAGNVSRKSYIKSDLDTAFLNDSLVKTLVDTGDVKKILNGTYSGPLSELAVAAVKVILAKNEVGVLDEKAGLLNPLVLSLNSNADPSYEVLGYALTAGGGVWASFGADGKLPIKITYGRDQTQIYPKDIKGVYLYKIEDRAALPPLSSLDPNKASKVYGPGSIKDSKGTALPELATPFDSATYEVELSDVMPGEYYIVTVEGTDAQNRAFAPLVSLGYGFSVANSFTPPSVATTFKDGGVYKELSRRAQDSGEADWNVGMDIKGEFSTTSRMRVDNIQTGNPSQDTDRDIYEGKNISHWSMRVENEEDNGEVYRWYGSFVFADENGNTVDFANVSSWNGRGTWQIDMQKVLESKEASAVISKINNSGSSYRFIFNGKFFNLSSGSAEITRSFVVDTKHPDAKITNVTPMVSGSSGLYCVNGKITVSAYAADVRLKTTELFVSGDRKDGSNEPVKVANKLNSIYTFESEEIDTTVFEDGKPLTFKFVATDSVGNETVVTNEDYIADQSTDRPSVDYLHIDPTLENAEAIKNAVEKQKKDSSVKTNIFSQSSTAGINCTITDDDGIALVKMYFRTEYEDESAAKSYSDTPGGSKSYSPNITSLGSLSEGLYFVRIEVFDINYSGDTSTGAGENNNKYDSGWFAVVVDNGAPEISITSPEEKSYASSIVPLAFGATVKDGSHEVTVSVADSSGGGGKIYNLKAGATDETNRLVAKTVTKDGVQWTTYEAALSDTIAPGGAADGSSDGSYTLTVTATDRYGQSAKKTVSYYIDNTAPSLKTLELDNKVFEGENSVTPSEIWFKSTQLKISGIYGSEYDLKTGIGSGIENIYYWVNPDSETLSAILNKDSIVNPSGTISAVRVKKGDEYFASFSSVVSGFVPGENHLRLKARDNVGNVSSSGEYSVQIDQVVPSFTSLYYTVDNIAFESASGMLRINGQNNLTVYGTISDGESGVNTIVFKGIDSNGVEAEIKPTALHFSTAEIADSDTDSSASFRRWHDENKDDFVPYNIGIKNSIRVWRATFDKDKINSGPFKAEPEDIARNSTSQQIFTLALDRQSPAITLNSPATKVADKNRVGEVSGDDSSAAATEITAINGTVTFSGTASDDYTLSSVALYWSLDGTASISATRDKLVGTAENTGAYSWSFAKEVSGADLHMLGYTDTYSGEPKTIYFKIVATDTAANQSVYVYQYSIDPDKDRPVITINNVDLAGMGRTVAGGVETYKYATLKSTNVVYGTVTDDDGVDELYYCLRSSAETEFGEWMPLPVSNGSWTATIDDGAYSIQFKVIDGAGGEFISSFEKSYRSPKLTDGKKLFDAGDTGLYLRVDKTPPQTRNRQYRVYNSRSASYSDWGDSFSGPFGGIYKKFDIQLEAKDDNDIDSVVASYSSNYATLLWEGERQGTDEEGWSTWKISDLDVSNGDGSRTVYLRVTDGAGLTTDSTVNIMVDNTPPEIAVRAPSSQITGEEIISGTVDDTSMYIDVFYAVSESGTDRPDESRFTQVNGVSRFWSIYFDNNIDTDTQTHDYFLKEYIVKLGIATREDIENNLYNELTPLYVWIKATDVCGNVAYKAQKVVVDPQSDRPKIEVTYPVEDSEDTVGGAVRLFGTATDNIAVKYAWVQIDVDGNGKWDSADIAKLLECKYTLGDMTVNSEITSASAGAVQDIAVRIPMTGSSWNLTINSSGEMNGGAKTENDGTPSNTNTVKLWFYATDADPVGDKTVIHRSAVVERTLVFDRDTPVIVQSSLNLVQYSDHITPSFEDGKLQMSGNIVACQEYTDGMSIKGVWYLVGQITDGSGIKKIVKNSETVIDWYSDPKKTGTSEFVQYGVSSDTGTVYNYIMNIPVGSDVDGSVGISEIEIIATENTTSNLFVSKTFVIKYDNKAPELAKPTDSGYGISSDIFNTNGFYTFHSFATEDAVNGVSQSGVKCVAFYFTRGDTLYDIMMKKDSYPNEYPLLMRDFKNSDGLYWKSQSINSVDGQTLKLNERNNYIHTGGLAKVNGVIYRIESVQPSDAQMLVTISGSPGHATEAFFAMANVIDNTTEEGVGSTSAYDGNGYGYGYYSDGSFDDGDCMPEKLEAQGTKYLWRASVNSKNIPDGNVTLHYVVFDEAGNYASAKVDNCVIKNNQPRIVGVVVGTDENGDGEVSESEKVVSASGRYAKGFDLAGNKVTEMTFPVSSTDARPVPLLTVRGKTVVRPEIVGGNGTVGWQLAVSEHNGTSGWKEEYYNENKDDNASVKELVSGSEDKDKSLVGKGTGDDDDNTIAGQINLEVKDFLEYGIKDGDNQRFTFLIWDNTSGGSKSDGDSQCAKLHVVMNVALRDTEGATNYIEPFYWNSASSNSLFNNSLAYGHIELSSDLPTKFTEAGAGVNTRQPKVSGIVKFEGIAHDNQMLAELTATVTVDAVKEADTFTFATYADGEWNIQNKLSSDAASLDKSGWAVDIRQATYSEYVRAGYIEKLPGDVKATDSVPYVSQETGHTVHWTLAFDTAKIAVGLNRNIAVQAFDRGSPTFDGNKITYTRNPCKFVSGQTGGTNGDEKLTSSYTVDVVPYVAKVYTGLATLNNRNWSVYNRTALGHYPVSVYSSSSATSQDENVKLYGFNLDGARIKDENLHVSKDTSAGSVYSIAEFSTKLLGVSGELELSVNDITVLNNENNNDVAYNQQPNGVNNDLLTDDIVFDVWELDSSAVVPISGKIEQPIMKINQDSGQIGFAFVNGPLYFSMGGTVGGTEYSYHYWEGGYDSFTSVGFAYDSLGYSYAVSAGGDTNSTSASKFKLLSSRWGLASRSRGGEYDAVNSRRLESIGQKNSNNIRDIDKQRIKSPSLATSVHGSVTTLYLAYYDAINDEIRFRCGSTNGSEIEYESVEPVEYVDLPDNGWKYAHIRLPENQTFFKSGSEVYLCNAEGKIKKPKEEDTGLYYAGPGTYGMNSGTDWYFRLCKKPNASEDESIQFPLPDNSYTESNGKRYPNENEPVFVKIKRTMDFGTFEDYDVSSDSYHYRNFNVNLIAGNNTGLKAGEYVSLGVVPGSSVGNDVVVVVWYDQENRHLLYSYATAPLSLPLGDNKTDSGWAAPVRVFAGGTDYENAGEYCQIAVDAKGGIHVAAYDPVNSDLVYAYSKSYSGSFETCVVDSSGMVGPNITLDVALNEGNVAIPHIGYYASSCVRPKYAYLVDTKSHAPAGAIDESFTGAWECTLVPTSSRITMQSSQHNKINVGVWKDKDGVLINSSTGTNSHTNNYNGYDSTSYGSVYGNGTNHAVLGYAIKGNSSTDAIETAQMK
ncbi:MAG: hypothetical protein J1D88_09390 [Treponema sp.]|nr:hypothetical protein [Treponema sp.]